MTPKYSCMVVVRALVQIDIQALIRGRDNRADNACTCTSLTCVNDVIIQDTLIEECHDYSVEPMPSSNVQETH